MFGVTLTPADGASGVSLDILASVGTSTSPASTGTKAVTGIGFQPKLVMPFGPAKLTADEYGDVGRLVLGASDGVTGYSIAFASNVGGATTEVYQSSYANIYRSLNTSGYYETANLDSLDADGFTLDWTMADSAANILNHICLGGEDLEVSCSIQTMNGTNADEAFAHGLSGPPTALLLFGIRYTAEGLIVANKSSIGFWAGGVQYGEAFYSNFGAATSAVRHYFSNVGICGNITSLVQRWMAIASVDATNVNVTYPTTTSTYAQRFCMVAIRGAKAKVGQFSVGGSASPLVLSCPGITPKLFIPMMAINAITNLNSVVPGIQFTLGASDGTNNVSSVITESNGQTVFNAKSRQNSTAIVQQTTSGTQGFTATATFDGESVIFDPADVSAVSYGQGAYLILGA